MRACLQNPTDGDSVSLEAAVLVNGKGATYRDPRSLATFTKLYVLPLAATALRLPEKQGSILLPYRSLST